MKKKIAIFCLCLILAASSFLSLLGCRYFRITGFYYGNYDSNHIVLTIRPDGNFMIEWYEFGTWGIASRQNAAGSFVLRGDYIEFDYPIENIGRILDDGNIELEFMGATLFMFIRRY
ncbi:MAG: hypothetical protein FWE03_01575 [Firmicutes bacterium]|nr:hypothetical protein [Bacillota bacterium]